jgi:hypothetical protein
MKRHIVFIGLLLVSIAARSQGSGEEALLKALHSISSHDLLEYVEIQCDEKYRGRLTGTEEYQECAEWLAGEMESWGVSPAGDDGGWFQWFKIPYTLVYPDCGLMLHMPLKKNGVLLKHYQYMTEYMPGSTSGNGEVTGEVVYVGYGITAPELKYDDYKGVDVKGKIVLVERESPVNPSAGEEKFKPWYEYSFHQYKLANAVKHGAAGMIYNYGPIANPNNDYYENFIYVHVGDSVVRDIFAGTGFSHRSVVSRIDSTLSPASFNTGKVVTVRMSTEHFPDGRGSNIIGMLKGTDPVLKDETIIIGAHLDHMGMCYELIPGANDNASAVAVMMGVARALAVNKIPLKRSVMFLSFGAEEQGIMGAAEYLKRPVMPLEKSVLLNMDGVGTGHSVRAAAGTNYPLLWSFVEDANKKYIHRPLSTNYFSNLGRPRLDAARFLSAGVPSLSFSTYGSVSYYHIPPDNLDIIKPEIMEDLCQMLFVTVVNMANSPEPLR